LAELMESIHLLPPEQRFHLSRMYIEVCFSQLKLMSARRARRASASWNLKPVDNLLANVESLLEADNLKELSHPSPQDRLLGQLAHCQTDWVADRWSNQEELLKLS